jgi:glycopeptide antibiotics resistance protein
LKKFKYALLYALFLLATSPFHLQVRNLLVNAQGFNFANYLLLGILAAFFALAFFKAVAAGKALDNAAVLLAAAIIFYLLFQRRIFLNKAYFSNFLHIAEFFVLGVVLFKENKRTSSAAPFVILLVAAFALEMVQAFLHDRVVDANDIWTNGIAGLAGMIAGYF